MKSEEAAILMREFTINMKLKQIEKAKSLIKQYENDIACEQSNILKLKKKLNKSQINDKEYVTV